MHTVSSKATAGIFACLIFTLHSYAFNGDSTKNSTAATIPRQANVLYPDMLGGQQEYFKDYVEQFALNRRAYLQRTYSRGKKFFPKAHSILKKYKVPEEFAVLLALESAFNPNAVSSAGAVGYWQIMDDVAKEYGLKIIEKETAAAKKKAKESNGIKKKVADKKKSLVTDERKNFQKSTHAAAMYLRDRMRNLNNDWLLVAASYNWGVGNVWNAMQRTGKTRPNFWDIKDCLPAETKSYVMNFIALNVVFKNYENFQADNLCFKNDAWDKKVEKDLSQINTLLSYLR
jgi:membrane-bound lytic murein transglycosylase MltF